MVQIIPSCLLGNTKYSALSIQVTKNTMQHRWHKTSNSVIKKKSPLNVNQYSLLSSYIIVPRGHTNYFTDLKWFARHGTHGYTAKYHVHRIASYTILCWAKEQNFNLRNNLLFISSATQGAKILHHKHENIKQ